MKTPSILYAGDGELDGAARYLYGVMLDMGARITHVPPDRPLAPGLLKKRFDLIILSDMPARHVGAAARRALIRQVERGAGFLMIGGWASFNGPFSGWADSDVVALLPVRCSRTDDRTNFPGGAWIEGEGSHPITAGLPLATPPAICGLNRVTVRKNGRVVLSVRAVKPRGSKVGLDGKRHPLLVVDSSPYKRIAALTTDLAPHWCGGLVDWGGRSRKIVIWKKNEIEVGWAYIRLVRNLVLWLCRK